MSESQVAAADDESRLAPEGAEGGEHGDEGGQEAIEARARLLGWKPKDEFRSGAPSDWQDAAEFVKRGEEALPLMRARNRRLEEVVTKMERRHQEAVQVVSDLTDRFRTADTRAYERARIELETEKRRAVDNADGERYDALEKQQRELEKQAPKPAPTPTPQSEVDPVVQEWAAENPWHKDADLYADAEALHKALLLRQPNLSLRENLDEVTRKIKAANPEKFRNARRDAPAAVNGASQEAGRRTNSRVKGYDEMPADAKAACARYQKMMTGKGKPLTNAEFAKTYWEDQE